MSCQDNEDFRDVGGYPCKGWLGFDCLKQASQRYLRMPKFLLIIARFHAACAIQLLVSGTSEGRRGELYMEGELEEGTPRGRECILEVEVRAKREYVTPKSSTTKTKMIEIERDECLKRHGVDV